jgi:phosphate transport system permease protein
MAVASAPHAIGRRRRLRLADLSFRGITGAAAVLIIVVLLGTAAFLVDKALPALRHYGVTSFLSSSRWAPSEATATGTHNPYGILQFVYGTLITSLIGMLIAVPASIAIALYITDVAPRRLRKPLSWLIDLLAAIPSVVYGFWGIFALIPALKPIGTKINDSLGKVPVIGKFFAGPFFGVSYFTAGIILAIMVLPIITAICREVFATAPRTEKEAALALGATRWEMLRIAVLPRSRSGIVGAAILGFGRAVGETIAVTMVIGNSVLAISTSIFGQGATMPSVIANEFTEATEPFHLSALFVVGMWLLIVALLVNTVGRLIVRRSGEHIA